jgi:D-serine deaminase-like pyridoxal phosphate-dependent protein
MITTPTLLVNEQVCRDNIRRMIGLARHNHIQFRPHFKTHQSAEIGQWFLEEGTSKITASSLSMAACFAEAGWKDITVAFPVNVREMETINQLAGRITLNLLVESVEAVKLLGLGLTSPVNVFIKLDVGTHRTGIDPENEKAIREVMAEIRKSKRMQFVGVLCHAGHSYQCRGKQEILAVHSAVMTVLQKIKSTYSDIPDLVISYGDTPTCSVADSFPNVAELRPGNFVFYDLMQWQIGSCQASDIGVAVACPVVAKHPERNEVVIYGGAVHFSKDFVEENGRKVYGKLAIDRGEGWEGLREDVTLIRLSQEHGILQGPDAWVASVKIGDLVKIIPVHSCLTMDLLRGFEVV